jgi:hypothetical protein
LSNRDWRKPDLSIDAISFAAPDATHANIYWSGNHTVLKGWAYLERIPGESTPKSKLKRVTLHAFPVCLMFKSVPFYQRDILSLKKKLISYNSRVLKVAKEC